MKALGCILLPLPVHGKPVWWPVPKRLGTAATIHWRKRCWRTQHNMSSANEPTMGILHRTSINWKQPKCVELSSIRLLILKKDDLSHSETQPCIRKWCLQFLHDMREVLKQGTSTSWRLCWAQSIQINRPLLWLKQINRFHSLSANVCIDTHFWKTNDSSFASRVLQMYNELKKRYNKEVKTNQRQNETVAMLSVSFNHLITLL